MPKSITDGFVGVSIFNRHANKNLQSTEFLDIGTSLDKQSGTAILTSRKLSKPAGPSISMQFVLVVDESSKIQQYAAEFLKTKLQEMGHLNCYVSSLDKLKYSDNSFKWTYIFLAELEHPFWKTFLLKTFWH